MRVKEGGKMIPIVFKWKVRFFQLFLAIFSFSFLLFLVYIGHITGFPTTWLIFILFCAVSVVWVNFTALVGTSCPSCKKWRARDEQHIQELDKDLIQIFWRCRFCGYEWDTKYEVSEGV